VSVRGRRLLPALLLAIALAAAGCGSKKTSSPTTSTTPPPTSTAPAQNTMPLTVYKIRNGVLVPTTVHVTQTRAVASAALAALGLPAKVSLAPGGTAVVELAHVTPAEAAEIVFTLTQFPAVQQVDVGGRHGLTRADVGSFAPLILVETPDRAQMLWALEEALRSGAPAAVAGAIAELDLKTSQRLHHAAREAGLPLVLLRPSRTREASVAATRWRIGTAEAARDRFGLITRWRWHLMLERCRNGRPGEWFVEFDHVSHRFSLAAPVADPATALGASAQARA